MEEAKVRLPSILIKDIRHLAVDGDHLTDQEASECSNTVKYHDVCRGFSRIYDYVKTRVNTIIVYYNKRLISLQ
jgi:hypothetical protein